MASRGDCLAQFNDRLRLGPRPVYFRCAVDLRKLARLRQHACCSCGDCYLPVLLLPRHISRVGRRNAASAGHDFQDFRGRFSALGHAGLLCHLGSNTRLVLLRFSMAGCRLFANARRTAFPPLIGYAPVIGAFGISWLLALTTGACVLLTRTAAGIVLSRRNRIIAALTVLAVWVIGGVLHQVSWTVPSGAPLTVALLQGNVEQSMKWRDDQREAALENYRQLVVATKARLIILPETALLVLSDAPADYLAALKRHSEANGGDVIIGVTIVERGKSSTSPYSVTNSAVTLGTSPPQRYDKQHLVVFGEFIPPYLSWVYQWLKIPFGSMIAGRTDQKPLQVAGHAVAVNICYEDAFGTEIVRQLPQAELLVNMSNMAWFGNLFAADQQAQFSQMRALETGRWILRSTNTGVTAAINEKGQIVRALPQFVRGALEIEAQPRTGSTPYVLWNDWLIWGLLLLALACGCAIKSVDRYPARFTGHK